MQGFERCSSNTSRVSRSRLACAACALLVLGGTPAAAQGVLTGRAWADVSFAGGLATQDDVQRSVSFGTGGATGELTTFTGEYPSGSGFVFDFGGGALVARGIGVGLQFTRSSTSDEPTVGVRVPHPTIGNAFASAETGDLAELERQQWEIGIRVMVPVMDTDQLRVRVFGGPSYFRVDQQLIGNIFWTQTFSPTSPTPHSVVVDRFVTLDGSESTWGFHIGGDVSTFFTPSIGVGAFLKYATADVEFTDIFSLTSDDAVTFDLDALTVGVGLHFRF